MIKVSTYCAAFFLRPDEDGTYIQECLDFMDGLLQGDENFIPHSCEEGTKGLVLDDHQCPLCGEEVHENG
jgi:hypothetical protein